MYHPPNPNSGAYSTTSRPESYYYEQQPNYGMNEGRQPYPSYQNPAYYIPQKNTSEYDETSRREFRQEPSRVEYQENNRRPQTSMEHTRYFDPRFNSNNRYEQPKPSQRPPSTRSTFHHNPGYIAPLEQSQYERRIPDQHFQPPAAFPTSRASSRNTNIPYQRSVTESEHGDPVYSRMSRVHRPQPPPFLGTAVPPSRSFVPDYSKPKQYSESYGRFEGESEYSHTSPKLRTFSRPREDDYASKHKQILRQSRSQLHMKPPNQTQIREEIEDSLPAMSPAVTHRTEEAARVKALPDMRSNSKQMEALLNATSALKIGTSFLIKTSRLPTNL